MRQDGSSEALGDLIEDAHAMEQRSLHTLDSIISTTGNASVRDGLEQHRQETELHAERLLDQLDAMGRSPSGLKEAQGLVAAAVEAFKDEARSDQTRQNIRDLYGAEHAEIATYELLERLAERVENDATAQVARENRRDEEAMAQLVAANWDLFVDLAVDERRDRTTAAPAASEVR